MATDLPARLGAWLSEQDGRPIEVHDLALASAGARRVNALFRAVDVGAGPDGGAERRLALTMIPTVAIQILEEPWNEEAREEWGRIISDPETAAKATKMK